MSTSSDIEKLFKHFGGDNEAYQEISRENDAKVARSCWPLLTSLNLSPSAVPPVELRRVEASAPAAPTAPAAPVKQPQPVRKSLAGAVGETRFALRAGRPLVTPVRPTPVVRGAARFSPPPGTQAADPGAVAVPLAVPVAATDVPAAEIPVSATPVSAAPAAVAPAPTFAAVPPVASVSVPPTPVAPTPVAAPSPVAAPIVPPLRPAFVLPKVAPIAPIAPIAPVVAAVPVAPVAVPLTVPAVATFTPAAPVAAPPVSASAAPRTILGKLFQPSAPAAAAVSSSPLQAIFQRLQGVDPAAPASGKRSS